MRTRVVLVVALALLGSPARAGQLAGATFSLAITPFSPVHFTAAYSPGMGSAGGGPGSAAVWSIQAGGVPGGTTNATLNSNAMPPLTYIQFIVNGNPDMGQFAHGGGTMLVLGVVNVWGLGQFPAGAPPLLGVPLALGLPGTVMFDSVGIFFTNYANAWTTQTTAIDLTTTLFRFVTPGGGTRLLSHDNLTPMGSHYYTLLGETAGTLSATLTRLQATGANGLVGGEGVVVLVSAFNVMSSIAAQFPAFGTLSLQYVPEPGALLLLGSVIAGLVAAGSRRPRSR